MNEFELIQRYLVQPNPPESVRVGNGDDCAVFAVNPGYELCISIDATIAGRHVPLVTPGALFAERALRRALSDLAACGATPKYLLISFTSLMISSRRGSVTLARLCIGSVRTGK